MPKTITTSRRRASRLILVLGGAASGKSRVALERAGHAEPKAFVATGQALDGEMAARIAKHQATRPSDWITAEVPRDLAAWITADGKRYRTIVVDCLTLWLSNLCGRRIVGAEVAKPVEELLRAIRSTTARVVLVSNELGGGLVPTGRDARAFRDLSGFVNQQIAQAADEVYLVVAGLPLRLK